MTRVKGGTTSQKRRKHLLEFSKGYQWKRKSHYRAAKEALMHAWEYAYRDRRNKKRDFRQLWQLQINAASRNLGLPYNKFINGLKKNKIELDRKILSELAKTQPEIFKEVVETVKK